MAGRPTKLNHQIADEIVKLLRAGNYVETACNYVGLHKDTFYHWMKRGERANRQDRAGGFVEFSDAIKKAMAHAEVRALLAIQKGGLGWQGSAWFLERRHRDRWCSNTRLDHRMTVANGNKRKIEALKQTMFADVFKSNE